MWLYTDILQALKGERLSSVISPDETLISASADPAYISKGGKNCLIQVRKGNQSLFGSTNSVIS